MRKNYSYPEYWVQMAIFCMLMIASLGFFYIRTSDYDKISEAKLKAYETVVTVTAKTDKEYTCSYKRADGATVVINKPLEEFDYEVGDKYTIYLDSSGNPSDFEGFEELKASELEKCSTHILISKVSLCITTLVFLILSIITLKNHRIRKRVMDAHDGEFNIEDVDEVHVERDSIFSEGTEEVKTKEGEDSIFDD